MALQRPKTMLTPFAHLQELRFDVPQEPLPGIDNKGRASYSLGWTEINAIPIEPDGSGGIAPFGQDFNGILHDITSHIVYQSHGNLYTFDPLIAANGGYSRGEVLVPDDRTWPMVLRSTIDNNTSNFNTNPEYIGQTWSVLGVMSGYHQGYNYPIPGLLVFHGLLIFYNKVPTGPAFGNATTPGTNEDIWETYVPGANGSYPNEPNTLALRDGTGKTMVSDPVADEDAVPKLYMEKYVDEKLGGSTDLARPVILSPGDGHVFGSLTIQVNVTELELLAGGTPIPSRTQIRVLSEDLDIIYTNRAMAYTTAPMAFLPDDFPVGARFKVIVRHEHDFTVWSPWSDPTASGDPTYTVDPVYPLRVKVLAPPDGTDEFPIAGGVITLASGAWSDGSPFNAIQTRGTIRTVSDDTIVARTGTVDDQWVPYFTSVTLPSGLLSPATDYWVEAQHKADGPPPTNPNADTATPEYDRTLPESSTFRTSAASPPDISGLQHDIPPEVLQGTFSDVKIWGATSTDGGLVTYKLVNITGGLSFSKTSGIFDNDILAMAAPTISGNVQNATLAIIAVSSFGADSTPVPVNVDIYAGLTQGMSVGRSVYGAATLAENIFLSGSGSVFSGPGTNYVTDVFQENLTRTLAAPITITPTSNFSGTVGDAYIGVASGGYYSAVTTPNYNQVGAYNPDLSFSLLANRSSAAKTPAVVGTDNHLIIGGGQIPSTTVATSVVDAYDINKSSTFATNLGKPLADLQVGANSELTFFMGGLNAKFDSTPYGSNSVYILTKNLAAGIATSIPRSVYLGGAGGNSAYAFMAGGIAQQTGATTPTVENGVYVFNINVVRTTLQSLSVARILPVVIPTKEGRFLVCGGSTSKSSANRTSIVDIYEPDLSRTIGTPLQQKQVYGNGSANSTFAICADGDTGTLTVNAYDKDLNHTWAD